MKVVPVPLAMPVPSRADRVDRVVAAVVKTTARARVVTVAVKAESAVAGLTLMPALVDAVKGAGFDAEPEF